MLKTSKPKIKKQIEQNHSIPLSQISPNWNPIFFGTFALTEAPYTKKSSFRGKRAHHHPWKDSAAENCGCHKNGKRHGDEERGGQWGTLCRVRHVWLAGRVLSLPGLQGRAGQLSGPWQQGESGHPVQGPALWIQVSPIADGKVERRGGPLVASVDVTHGGPTTDLCGWRLDPDQRHRGREGEPHILGPLHHEGVPGTDSPW